MCLNRYNDACPRKQGTLHNFVSSAFFFFNSTFGTRNQITGPLFSLTQHYFKLCILSMSNTTGFYRVRPVFSVPFSWLECV